MSRSSLKPLLESIDADLPEDAADEDVAEAESGIDLGLDDEAAPASVRNGAAIIRHHWRTLPMGPGVYRMLGGLVRNRLAEEMVEAADKLESERPRGVSAGPCAVRDLRSGRRLRSACTGGWTSCAKGRSASRSVTA